MAFIKVRKGADGLEVVVPHSSLAEAAANRNKSRYSTRCQCAAHKYCTGVRRVVRAGMKDCECPCHTEAARKLERTTKCCICEATIEKSDDNWAGPGIYACSEECQREAQSRLAI